MLKIVAAPNPVLSQSAKKILKIDKPLLNFIEKMKKTLLAAKDPEGVGLAAPQVGESLALFIAKPTPKSPIQVFINPLIRGINTDQKQIGTDKDQQKSVQVSTKIESASKRLEGCLSLLNIWGEVKREPQISVSYLDEKDTHHTKTYKGLMATIIQHEEDHLKGILFPKKVLEQGGKLYKSHRNEKGEDIFEEIEL